MPTYHHAIQQKTPLTKELIWSQCKADYQLKDSDVTEPLKAELRKLCDLMVKNRDSTAIFGYRVIEEMKYRKALRDLFLEDLDEYLDKQAETT